MKKYALFGGDVCYPAGGFDDFIAASDSLDELKVKGLSSTCKNYDELLDWADIVDLETMNRVLSMNFAREWETNTSKPSLSWSFEDR